MLDATLPKNSTAHKPSPVLDPGRRLTVAVCLLLALLVWAVFGQTVYHEFVNYDTDIYVYENPDIARGLSWQGILWAFTHLHVDEWWPLNAISHMLDCELFGLNPGGHHFTNVLIHSLTAVFLFLVIRSMTGAFWRSAFVAAVFAIHPLRVESVAWVTERKDMLSGFFFVLTLAAYVRYVRKGCALKPYLLVILCFTLGLLSKSMLVTMPFLLLLLDWWPLRRLNFGHPLDRRLLKRLILEKIPMLILAIGASMTTMLAVTDLHAIDELSLRWRLANAVVSYAAYLRQMIYPANLAVFYPHPENELSLSVVALCAFALFLITLGVIGGIRRRPYLFLGWFWYLGMLIPVLGIIQVGIQARADRYTYLPQIGLYILLAWGIADISTSWRKRREILTTAAIAVLGGLVVSASIQTSHWRNSFTLWSHTAASTYSNPLAHHQLGNLLMKQGKVNEAIFHYQQAVRFKPNYVRALNNLGVALSSQGRSAEAIPLYHRVLQRRPNYPNARFNLGMALAEAGQWDDAIREFDHVLRLKPGAADIHYHLALALDARGRSSEAIAQFERALRLRPDYPDAHHKFGVTLAAQGRLPEAVHHYQRALQLRPGSARTYYRLGNALAAAGYWDDARQQFERALQLNPTNADACNNLGNALATLGKLDEAIPYFERTIEMNPAMAEAHGNLGSALTLQGETEAAVLHLKKALELATIQTNAELAEAMKVRLTLPIEGDKNSE